MCPVATCRSSTKSTHRPPVPGFGASAMNSYRIRCLPAFNASVALMFVRSTPK
jgi:hypothetical protein